MGSTMQRTGDTRTKKAKCEGQSQTPLKVVMSRAVDEAALTAPRRFLVAGH